MIYARFDNTNGGSSKYLAMGGIGDMLGRFCTLVQYLTHQCASDFHLYAPYETFKPSHMEDDERRFVFELFDPLHLYQTPYEVGGEEVAISGPDITRLADLDPKQDHYVVVRQFKTGKGGLDFPGRRLSFGELKLTYKKRPSVENIVIHLRRGDLAFYGQDGLLYDKVLGVSESESCDSIRAKHPRFTLEEPDLEGLPGEARLNTIRRTLRPGRAQISVQMCEMLIARLAPTYQLKVISDGYNSDYRERFSLDPDALGGNRRLQALRERGVDVIVKGDQNHIEDTWTALHKADLIITPTRKSVALLPSLLGAYVLPINDVRHSNLDTRNDAINFSSLKSHAEALEIPISWKRSRFP